MYCDNVKMLIASSILNCVRTEKNIDSLALERMNNCLNYCLNRSLYIYLKSRIGAPCSDLLWHVNSTFLA